MKLTENEILRVVAIIQSNTDFTFEYYSTLSLGRRITKVLYDFELDINALIAKLEVDADLCKKVAHLLLVGHTDLFRNPEMWQILKQNIIDLFSKNDDIYIWHAGCSTGEEVYSMIMLLNELELLDRAHILATDVNQDALEQAKLGEYNYKYHLDYFKNFDEVIRRNPFYGTLYNAVPYSRYFTVNEVNKTIKIHEQFKQKITWVRHDLVNWTDIFEDKFNIIMCRNVLIYFNVIIQFELLEKFSQNLQDNAILVLGKDEEIAGEQKYNLEKKDLFYIKHTQD